MSYTALYRKFRPADFGDVKGQDHIVGTLKNQLRTGRIGHAYLLPEPEGPVKPSVAKIMAKRSTANILQRMDRVMNVLCAKQLRHRRRLM